MGIGKHERESFHEEFERALSFAVRLHSEQVRKETGIPYVAHLIGVAALVLEDGGSRHEAIAALLHDAIEDQAEKAGGVERLRAGIREQFGDAVLRIVEGCTDSWGDKGPGLSEWRKRKEGYLKHLRHADGSTRKVSCADKLYNARTIVNELHRIGDAVWSRFKGGREGSLWYYRSLADEFRRGGPPALARELDQVVREMESLPKAP